MADENIDSKAPDLSVLNAWHDFGIEVAQKQHWEWFVIDQFLRGNHNITGNPNDNTIVVGKTVDSINYPINKIFATFRAVRAFVTRHKPYIVVDPEDSTPESIDYARKANSILQRDNKVNNFRKINKEWVYFGVKYGVGYRQIGYDIEKHCCVRWSVDPNDLVVVSQTGEMEDAPAIIKAVTKTLGYWKHKYPKDIDGKSTDDLAPDNKLADNQYKQLALEIELGVAGIAPGIRMGEQTKTGYECWYRIFKPNKLGGTVNKVVFVEEKVLDFQETPFNEYPFIPYKSDITPNEVSGEGHVKHLISPQRLLNLLNTQMLEYNHIVNRGRFLKDKNAGFRVINTREGQIIERNPGKRVEALNPPSINPMLDRQLNLAINFIEDLGGQHQASMGAAPARVSSGDAIEALQLGDSNNITDLRDNFEDALELEAAWILKMYSLFEKDGVIVKQESPEGISKFAVVGQEAYQRTGSKIPEQYFMEDNGDYCDVCAVLPEHNIKVSVASQLGETRAAKTETLMRLVEHGFPLIKAMEFLEFPNTTDIAQRMAEEAVAELKIQQLQAQMAPAPGQQVPGQQQGGTPAESSAPNQGDQILSELEQMTGNG